MRGSSVAVLYMLYQAGRKCKGCATGHGVESTFVTDMFAQAALTCILFVHICAKCAFSPQP